MSLSHLARLVSPSASYLSTFQLYLSKVVHVSIRLASRQVEKKFGGIVSFISIGFCSIGRLSILLFLYIFNSILSLSLKNDREFLDRLIMHARCQHLFIASYLFVVTQTIRKCATAPAIHKSTDCDGPPRILSFISRQTTAIYWRKAPLLIISRKKNKKKKRRKEKISISFIYLLKMSAESLTFSFDSMLGEVVSEKAVDDDDDVGLFSRPYIQ